MANDDGTTGRRFHHATKHSVQSLQREPHTLDWDNQPLPLKIYKDLSGEDLPQALSPSGVSTFEAIRRGASSSLAGKLPDRAALGRLLYFSLGITRRRRLADGRSFYFRAAPCTGALYHIDAYLVCGDLPDLAAGVYHFGPHDFALRRLRSGDWRGVIAEASGEEPRIAAAPAVLVLASTYWRNAWKYQRRAYRHVFWDGGAVLAQLLAQAAVDGWPAAIVLGFADHAVERLCGLDATREGAVALVPIGSVAGAVNADSRDVEAISTATEPLSPNEIEYPAIPETHAAGSLDDGEEARRWRSRAPALMPQPPRGPLSSLSPDSSVPDDPLEAVIVRRGSTRVFSRRPISPGALAKLLAAASAPLPADYRAAPGAALVELLVIANAVENLPAGSYRWHPRESALEELSRGERRAEAGRLALGQGLAADAAVNIYAIADLEAVLAALGTRGYRAATLDGGIAGGRIYLGAYAERLGATGLTFFDDDVTRFFGLDPDRFGVMFLTAAGVPA